MRIKKTGEVVYKPSAYKQAQRLAADPLPMKLYVKGASVKVYLGCGWGQGRVHYSDKSRCLVYLLKEQRITCCTDNRNITDAS